MAFALTCDEPTEERRAREEKALFHHLKDYLNICNNTATNDQANLGILASDFELTKNDFVFVIYTIKRWQNYIADSMCKYVEEKYHEMIQGNKINECRWFWTAVIPDKLQCCKYYIDSPHTLTYPTEMYQHEVNPLC